jgi:hypothetical protein
MNKICMLLALGVVSAFPATVKSGDNPGSVANVNPVILSREGKKIDLPGGMYFTYQFSSKPALGSTVLKISVYSSSKKKNTNLEIKGSYDMPEMRGMGGSEGALFKLNKKGDYLLPITITMPGNWEVVVTIKDKTSIIFTGKINIRV